MTNGKPASVIAALEHLTGPSRGEVDWIVDADTEARLAPGGRRLTLIPAGTGSAGAPFARLRRMHGAIRLEAGDGAEIWVNGLRVAERQLVEGDIIEFGQAGPLSRLRLYRQGEHQEHTVRAILANTIAYLRNSRQPWPRRLWRGGCSLAVNLLRETSIAFRGFVVIAILGLGWLLYRETEESARIAHDLAGSAVQLEALGQALEQARAEALTARDLSALKEELAAERAAALAKLSRASADAIAAARTAVVFLQGAYGFREVASSRMLRHVIDASGRKLVSPVGSPLLSLEGGGPIAERQFTGTGFLLAGDRGIATNRHVALPWERDEATAALKAGGFEPTMLRMIGWLPGAAAPFSVALTRASARADLAVLRPTNAPDLNSAPGLALAEDLPEPGAEAIVLGYPTGLRTLLAQAGQAFVEQLQAEGVSDFWIIAERLGAGGHIEPLASRGIVGQATAEVIVYDAETTHGGSGGPVLDAAGRVVAVNRAILPEYGGSNIGVPVALLKDLLAEIDAPPR